MSKHNINKFKNSKASSPSDDNSSSTEASTSRRFSQRTDRLELDNKNMEKPIPLNEFLDLLKVSCRVNDMIAIDLQNEAKTIISGGASNSNSEIDFKELANNSLVNELLGHKKHDSKQQGTQRNDSDNVDLDQSLGTENSQSKSGLSIGTFSRRSTKKSEKPTTPHLHSKLDEKLNYVINEGVMDSVFSFICPVPAPATFSNRSKAKPKESSQQCSSARSATVGADVRSQQATVYGELTTDTGASTKTKEVSTKDLEKETGFSRRRSLFYMKEHKEPEVIIHVCDEVKNTTCDFSCPQRVLVSRMGYFADVTAGQKLNEMDISVHCDIQIFEWLMKWVKYRDAIESTNPPKSITSDNDGPLLDANNVIPILVSASFLQMEPLLVDCLSFCHAHLDEVVRSSTNVSCLNESIIERLAEMFTNLELEMVRDKRDRLIPRLWIKLIQSLCESEPEALRGHYYSLAGLFRCSKCGKCLTNTLKSYIPCVSSNMRLNRWGQLVSYHVPSSSWNMSSFISNLFKELKSWRKVYWRLWGICHFLYCCTCEKHFPVYQLFWCRYHPESPNFLGPVTEGRIAGPAGRFPCCGQQAFRFETLPGLNGCNFREHSVVIESNRERSILQTVQIILDNNALCEYPSDKCCEVIAKGVSEPHWLGMPLIPLRSRKGLLPTLNPDDPNIRVVRHTRNESACFAEYTSDSDTSDTVGGNGRGKSGKGAKSRNYYSSSDGCDTESSGPKISSQRKKGKKREIENPGLYWCGDLSARSNQDHQREYEERVMKQVVAIVNKKTGSDHNLMQNITPLGGVYVRLESEWKEQLKHRSHAPINTASVSNNSSSSNLNKGKNKY